MLIIIDLFYIYIFFENLKCRKRQQEVSLICRLGTEVQSCYVCIWLILKIFGEGSEMMGFISESTLLRM